MSQMNAAIPDPTSENIPKKLISLHVFFRVKDHPTNGWSYMGSFSDPRYASAFIGARKSSSIRERMFEYRVFTIKPEKAVVPPPAPKPTRRIVLVYCPHANIHTENQIALLNALGAINTDLVSLLSDDHTNIHNCLKGDRGVHFWFRSPKIGDTVLWHLNYQPLDKIGVEILSLEEARDIVLKAGGNWKNPDGSMYAPTDEKIDFADAEKYAKAIRNSPQTTHPLNNLARAFFHFKNRAEGGAS